MTKSIAKRGNPTLTPEEAEKAEEMLEAIVSIPSGDIVDCPCGSRVLKRTYNHHTYYTKNIQIGLKLCHQQRDFIIGSLSYKSN